MELVQQIPDVVAVVEAGHQEDVLSEAGTPVRAMVEAVVPSEGDERSPGHPGTAHPGDLRTPRPRVGGGPDVDRDPRRPSHPGSRKAPRDRRSRLAQRQRIEPAPRATVSINALPSS